jgi:hypothetical protein
MKETENQVSLISSGGRTKNVSVQFGCNVILMFEILLQEGLKT